MRAPSGDRRPALFGGTPAFPDRPLGTAQLGAPDRETLLALVEGILERRLFTDRGPLVERLERRLAELHGVEHCVCMANGSFGLLALLRLLTEGRPGGILMPSFSFRGLPFMASMLGREPVFTDVEPRGGTLHVEEVEAVLATVQVAAILAVHNVHWACDADALEEVAARHGVPVLYDSVWGLMNTLGGRILGDRGAAEVFSLHATKLLNGFEGGYATTNDGELARALRALVGDGWSHLPGLHAPLNELHAGTALASVDRIPALVAGNRRRYERYREHVAGIEGLSLVPLQPGERLNHASCLLEVTPDSPLSREALLRLLNAENILARPYYSPPLHRVDAWREVPRPRPLPVTESLAGRIVQLPVGERVGLDDVPRICETLAGFQRHGEELAGRMAKGEARP